MGTCTNVFTHNPQHMAADGFTPSSKNEALDNTLKFPQSGPAGVTVYMFIKLIRRNFPIDSQMSEECQHELQDGTCLLFAEPWITFSRKWYSRADNIIYIMAAPLTGSPEHREHTAFIIWISALPTLTVSGQRKSISKF